MLGSELQFRSIEDRGLPSGYYLLVFFSYFVLFGLMLILQLFGWPATPPFDSSLQIDGKLAALKEASKRIYVLALGAFYLVLCLGSAIYCVSELIKNNSRRTRVASYAIFGISLVLGAFFWVWYGSDLVIVFHQMIGPDWTKASLDYGRGIKNIGEVAIATGWSYEQFMALVRFVSVVTGILNPIFALALVTCLETPDTQDAEKVWKRQVSRFKTTTILISVCLVAGVLLVKEWTSFAPVHLGACVGDSVKTCEALATAFTGLSNSLSIYIGFIYSTMMACVVVPATYILLRQAEEIAASQLDSARIDKTNKAAFSEHLHAKQQDLKLTFSFGDLVKAIATIIAPLFTGAISTVLTSF